MNQLIQQIVAERDKRAAEQTAKVESQRSSDHLLGTLAAFFDGLLDDLKAHTGKVRVVNLPSTQKVVGEVEVKGLGSLAKLIAALISATKANKLSLPETQQITGEVTVKNQVTIPDVKFPEYPKQTKTDVVSLPKYVGEKLDSLTKAVKSLELNPEVKVSTPAPEVNIDLDLKTLEGKIDLLLHAIQGLGVQPQITVDTEGLKEATKQVEQAIRSQVFPVPNFQSSWSHSFEMQSKDLPMTLTYATVNSKKVIDYIEVTASDNHVYRKTFGYDADGDITSKSAWVRQ